MDESDVRIARLERNIAVIVGNNGQSYVFDPRRYPEFVKASRYFIHFHSDVAEMIVALHGAWDLQDTTGGAIISYLTGVPWKVFYVVGGAYVRVPHRVSITTVTDPCGGATFRYEVLCEEFRDDGWYDVYRHTTQRNFDLRLLLLPLLPENCLAVEVR